MNFKVKGLVCQRAMCGGCREYEHNIYSGLDMLARYRQADIIPPLCQKDFKKYLRRQATVPDVPAKTL